MAVTTLGRQLVREALPAKYKSFADQPLTAKRQQQLTTMLAKEDPDAYIDILQNLNAIGQRVVSVYGKDTTITLDDVDAGAKLKNTSAKLKELIRATINRKDLTPQQKEQKIIQLGYKYSAKMKQLGLQDANTRKTGLANQIASGSRGNPVQLMQLIIGDMMMKDAMNRDIPYLAMMPYVEGDSPLAYWASAMSGRKSTYDVQAATGRVGYLSKQATNTTHSTPISTQDCGTTDTGVPVKASDPQNIGSVLLYPWKGHKAGTPVDEDMIAQADDDQEFIIRSPITCKAHGGVCAKCAGIQENGKFPATGTYVALNSVKSFIEPLTQAGISCLHPDTKIRMANWDVKCIKDIVPGDMVLGADKQGNCRPVKVNYVFRNGIQPMYKFTYKASKGKHTGSFIATEKHKFLSRLDKGAFNQYALQSQCKRYDIALPTSLKVIDGTYHEDMAFLLGFLCGDGCYSPGVKGQVHFSCADPSLVKYLEGYTAKFGMYVHLCAGQKIYYSIGKLVRGSEQSPIKKALIKYGMMGKYSWQKTLPNNWREWDEWSIKQFISGLVTADGHIGIHVAKRINYRFNIGSVSLQLLEQVKECLQKYLGIPFLHITSSPYQGKKTLHLLQVSSLATIQKIISWLDIQGIKCNTKQKILSIRPPKTTSLPYVTLTSKEYVGQIEAFDIEVDHPDHIYLLQGWTLTGNSKHGSGMGGVKASDPEGQDQPQGFDSVQRMLLAPKVFPGGAVLSTVDGRVTQIRKAPQGGHFITVGNTTVYSPVARTVTAKVGDVVEAGDMLTNGVPNPMQIVRYKGIGQGRHYFTKKLSQILPKTGAGTLRRNLEEFSRAMINKVRITDDDGYGGYYPGDLVDYDDIQDKWVPRDDSKELDVKDAKGTYLQKPALYYSIGTRITPSVMKKLQQYGVSKIVTNAAPPPFEPQFVPSKQFVLQDKNWLPRLSGQRLRDSIFDAARKGITDRYDSHSFVDKIIVEPYNPAK